MIVLDACVVIAFLNPDDIHHTDAVQVFDAAKFGELSISSITLAETLVWPSQSGRADEAFSILRGLGVRVISVGEESALPLAELRWKSRLKLPDSLVLLTALTNQATLATFDAALAREARTRGLEVIGA